MASKRRVGAEDYVDGQAYLEWKISVTIVGQRYDLRPRFKVVHRMRDPQFGLPFALNVPRAELPGRCRREYELVLIDYVQFVKRHERIIPSWIGLYVSADLFHGHRGLARLALQNKSLDLEIKLLDDAVWAAAEVRGDCSLEVSSMRLRPLNL